MPGQGGTFCGIALSSQLDFGLASRGERLLPTVLLDERGTLDTPIVDFLLVVVVVESRCEDIEWKSAIIAAIHTRPQCGANMCSPFFDCVP